MERERHAVAVHEACHAVVAYRTRKHLLIDIATIEKGGSYLGMVSHIPPEEQFTTWRSNYESDIMTYVASLVGERLFFGGDSSSGVGGDLHGATRIAMGMEGYWGMGQTVASHAVNREPGSGPVVEREKDILEGELGQKMEAKLQDLLRRTEQVLKENRLEVLAVAHALETHKTVTGDDIEAIIEGRQGPLLDGRPYHTPEFARLADAYHDDALEAHRAHAAVKVPLPVLTAAYEVAAEQTTGDGSNGEVAEGAPQEEPEPLPEA